jgi:hypothetical protein
VFFTWKCIKIIFFILKKLFLLPAYKTNKKYKNNNFLRNIVSKTLPLMPSKKIKKTKKNKLAGSMHPLL